MKLSRIVCVCSLIVSTEVSLCQTDNNEVIAHYIFRMGVAVPESIYLGLGVLF